MEPCFSLSFVNYALNMAHNLRNPTFEGLKKDLVQSEVPPSKLCRSLNHYFSWFCCVSLPVHMGPGINEDPAVCTALLVCEILIWLLAYSGSQSPVYP